MMRAMRRALPCCLALLMVAGGCGDNMSHGGGPRAAFELPPAGEVVPVAAVPFPNDLYFDGDGQLEIPVDALPFGPGADPEVMANVSASFAELDCYGPGAGVIFPLAGLAEGDQVAASSLTDETALLIDLERGERVAVDTVVRPVEQQVFLRPRRGRVLRGGATYAALLTRGVTLDSGRPLPGIWRRSWLAGRPGDSTGRRALTRRSAPTWGPKMPRPRRAMSPARQSSPPATMPAT
jgi:hypothetical protein